MIEKHQVGDKWWRQIESGCAGLMTESMKFAGDSAVTCVVLSPYEADRLESDRLMRKGSLRLEPRGMARSLDLLSPLLAGVVLSFRRARGKKSLGG